MCYSPIFALVSYLKSGGSICADGSLLRRNTGLLVDEVLLRLLKACKDGDGDAFTELEFRYSPLVDSILKKYSGCGVYTEDDFRQEAEIALYNAVYSYDTAQEKVTFGLYAGICIRNRLATLARDEKRRNRCYVMPGKTEFSFGNDLLDPEEIAVSAETYSELLGSICDRLTVYEREIFGLYLRGMSVGEIAEHIGRERKSVENAVCRIRNKIRGICGDKK